ncbi:MAG: DegT/DnrJ/EryC1/StrS aminotransferase family protein [Deltaproteobacteria bacterium]|jgi:dTDP-4-amino-4,6-dideoxygalactose transaminase|nr:DegT/DnrJ/EryC1/StrS aminotransferase family protein [Deltaproteobacteria bacterium]
MQFIDLAAQQQRIRNKIESNISAILDHGKYIMGPEVKELEDRLADYVGVKNAIGCASGTDALLMALMTYQAGPGDAIFTSPFTFIATAEVISLLGATPVFVDIDPQTYNMDSGKLDLAIQAVKNNDHNLYPLPAADDKVPITPKGVIAVDLFGLPADYDGIDNIAKKDNLFVIEDAAQSFGAEIAGKKACAYGNIACTSFFPAKPLGCYGDGGMCFTDDAKLSEKMESIRVHGKGHHKYDNVRIGVNGRLDTLQAGILLAKLEIFPQEIELRQQVAERYTELLKSQFNLMPPTIPPGYKSAWAQYSILAQNAKHRSDMQNRLKASNIPTAIYYPKPLHLQSAFSYLGYRNGDFPVSEDCAGRIFSLPMHPYLAEKDQQKIAEIIVTDDE